jgi:hypothetical protein
VRLIHKTPCAECPWRTVCTPGWLGGFTAEQYADPVQENEVPACHLRDHGPENDNTAFCVGALSVMANSCISAWKSPGGDAAKQIIGRRDDTFRHPALFYEHHTGKPYTIRILRVMNGEQAA